METPSKNNLNKQDIEKIQETQLRLLKREFQERCTRNPNYSLRSFAKSLNLSHSYLSLIFSKKRKISFDLATKIVNEMNFGQTEKRAFLAKENPIRLKEFKVNEDFFDIFKDPLYLIILSFVELSPQLKGIKKVANQLMMSTLEVMMVIDFLTSEEFIQKKDDVYTCNYQRFTGLKNKSTPQSRSFHQIVLNTAKSSLDKIPEQERKFITTIFHLDQEHLPEAINKIEEFSRELTREFHKKKSKRKKDIHQLNIQIYPILKLNS